LKAILRQHTDRAVAAITHGLSAMGVACVVAMMFITTADVVARYVFNRPTMWADEMASYLLIAIVFLGLAQNLRAVRRQSRRGGEGTRNGEA